jgi:hypothetical protein
MILPNIKENFEPGTYVRIIIDKDQDKLWVFCVLNKLLMDEQDSIVSLNLQPFCPKGKTLSCKGHLNLIAI